MTTIPSRTGRGFSFGVFLANFNHARYLPQALDALLTQSLRPDEICVVDDCSSDNSRDIIRDYASMYDVITPIINEANNGYVKNANKWLMSCRHDFVFFAAADDFVLSELFEKSIRLLSCHPTAGLCSSLSYVLDERGGFPELSPSPLLRHKSGYVDARACANFLHREGSWFWGNVTIYRREAIILNGGFDASLHGSNDSFLSSVIAMRGGVCFIPEPQGVWRRFHSSSMSAVTFKDVALSTGILREIVRRLDTDMKDIAHPGYARRFAQRWLYGVIERTVREGGEDVRMAGDALRPYSPLLADMLPWLERLPCRMLRRIIVAVFLRWFDIIPMLKRRIIYRVGILRKKGKYTVFFEK